MKEPIVKSSTENHFHFFSSKCLICLMIFSSHAACVKHLARDHNVPEDKAAGKLANILPSASDTPMSISPTMISKDADEFNSKKKEIFLKSSKFHLL